MNLLNRMQLEGDVEVAPFDILILASSSLVTINYFFSSKFFPAKKSDTATGRAVCLLSRPSHNAHGSPGLPLPGERRRSLRETFAACLLRLAPLDV